MPKKKKVLLVDDEVDFVEINKAALENKGYEVIPAYNGEEGIQKALQERPDIIILDVMMETKTEGFEVARKLRKYEEMKNVPIIMLTAIRERMDIKFKIQPDEEWLPVTEFVEKPVPPDKLIEKVEQMLEKKK